MKTVPPHSPGIVRQRQLSDFLYAELLHTLGAYRLSAERFERLTGEFAAHEADDPIRQASTRGVECNEGLQFRLYLPGAPRQPLPGSSDELKPDAALLESVAQFYDLAIAVLGLPEAGDVDDTDMDPALRLKRVLSFPHDPQRRGRPSRGQWEALRRGRLMRMESRRKEVNDILAEPSTGSADEPLADVPMRQLAQELVEDHIQRESSPLYVKILKAMSEAHVAMHLAEYLRSQNFGEMFSTIPETYAKTQSMLRYSLALNTFVFVAARSVPWAFAEDEDERELILGHYIASCDSLTPTYCMWTAAQISFLALHRRAFTWWTMGRHDRAYRDFYKLSRLLRTIQEPAEKRAVRVPGTKTFIGGVTAMSELHIGRIYRGQHAHRMALRYFERASRHIEGWEEHFGIGEIIVNSTWRISLLINQAKANYELGQVKRSLLCYAQAWRAFLLLADSESHATANIDVVDGFIEWLQPIVDDPELARTELRRRLEPLVEQFETMRSPKHLERLAADIVMRIGHLIYILKLAPSSQVAAPDARGVPPRSDHDLAVKCIVTAAWLDPHSTLVAADRLKVEADARGQVGGEDAARPRRYKSLKSPPPPTLLRDQWPAGGDRFEETARIIEYTLHSWLAASKGRPGGSPNKDDVEVARKLLASFLAHTDSSNVKLAQVYRYLMRAPRAKKRRTNEEQCTLDFVCLRRYSSFFPFLPRPRAFRAAGGGYFVQARNAGEKEEPFGIAIDPGPDFVENLYRCGYSLADLHMIVVTHDHADHIASLDALLALMWIRDNLGEKKFDAEHNRLAIVGNESVVQRYQFFDPPPGEEGEDSTGAKERSDAVSVLRFGEMERITALSPEDRLVDEMGQRILPMPAGLRIEPVRTFGHRDAGAHYSQGFLLKLGDGETDSSILFTGDTGIPPKPGETPWNDERFGEGSKELLDAVGEADVVVAHLSGVPLKELRELAGLRRDGGAPPEVSEFSELWEQARETAEQLSPDRNEDFKQGMVQAGFLLRQLQFGFRTGPRKGEPSLGVSPVSATEDIKKQPTRHLYLTGLLQIARRMREGSEAKLSPPLLVIGELREELGTFRTRIATHISEIIFRRHASERTPTALTGDLGLRVRLARPNRSWPDSSQEDADKQAITVLCTTCDLDNDLVPTERFHRPHEIREVCVKGEDEGVFYNCLLHDPSLQPGHLWLEAVERYDPFADDFSTLR